PPVKPPLQLPFPNIKTVSDRPPSFRRCTHSTLLRKIARNCIKTAYTEGSLCWFRATPRNPKIKTVLQGDGSL
ncbi:hypothetical protein GP954_42510, partial [Escherichia coli]|nr:hypothetical protein [Escherichia coli]